MTVQEALSQGLSVTGVGLAIVFAVLIILMLVMILMKKVFYKEQPAKVQAKAVPVETVVADDDEELIAVLTAAIAASLNTSTYNLKIKSYRRIQSSNPTWNRAGIEETIGSRF